MTSSYGGSQGGYQGGYWNGSDWQAWDPAYPHPTAAPPGWGYPPPGPQQYGPAPGQQPMPHVPAARATHSRGLVGAVVALSLALVAALAVIVTGVARSTGGTAIAGGTSGGSGGTVPTQPTPGNSTAPFQPGGSSSGGSSGRASSAQQVGVVDIYTQQKYNAAAAAGTGIVLTSSGDVLTNNHVIEGSTSIKVRIVSTGKSYVAKVVGTAPTKDVAVLHLVNASGLTTAGFGDSNTVALGDAVTGVGNAGGVGGTPSAASGKVTALHRAITASDETGTNAERLKNIIVTNAPIRSGDSGGPLYDSTGRVIGMDTAASTNGPRVGFAIPINDARSIAGQIQKGIETSSIHIGYPGFLGVSVAPSHGSGAVVEGVLGGGPAAKAGISAGDVITRVNATSITGSAQLHNLMSTSNPGSTVTVTYRDPHTGRHTVSLTLATGPAD
ncbi:MAG TPA: trypsin-like peptidase domain-containing protein [Jatrophihabitans sp.]